MAELLFNEFFCTYPFHIFAYLPFHSTLRISGRKILLVSVMAELLYLTVFALLVSSGLPAVYVQYTAIPVFGIFLYSLVKANVGIITFQYIFVIDYLMVIRACAFFVCQTFFHNAAKRRVDRRRRSAGLRNQKIFHHSSTFRIAKTARM